MNIRKYKREGNIVRIKDWINAGSYQALPSGTTHEEMSLADAREDWKKRVSGGYTRTA